MKRILCFLFSHRWIFIGDWNVLQPPEAFFCERCGKRLAHSASETVKDEF